MTGSGKLNRRRFLKQGAGLAAALWNLDAHALGIKPEDEGFTKLTLLYTNDTHSRIEPFPDNDPKYAGEGGFARRAALIEAIRKEDKHVLLLDAGDIFQGTPYFNFYHGEVEYKLMTLMRYDATTFGNHDFDLGCENIVKQMPHAGFDFINCNYRFDNTALAKHPAIKPYRVYKKGPLKIGVLGVGIELENLVDKKYVKGIVYDDPVSTANKIAAVLKHEEKCDYIICLSHLGYSYDSKKISDLGLAAQSKNIDLIIGGHTHTFLEKPNVVQNAEGRQVSVTQVGWAGIWLGKIELFFSEYNENFLHRSNNQRI